MADEYKSNDNFIYNIRYNVNQVNSHDAVDRSKLYDQNLTSHVQRI